MTTVEVVITVRVPEGTGVEEVTETVASWSAPLDAGVGWRVLALEGVEPAARISVPEDGEDGAMASTCIWCADDVPEGHDACSACVEVCLRQMDEERRGIRRSEDELWAELIARRERR